MESGEGNRTKAQETKQIRNYLLEHNNKNEKNIITKANNTYFQIFLRMVRMMLPLLMSYGILNPFTFCWFIFGFCFVRCCF